jgi:alpha-N-arabinofuranosidase
MPKGVTNQRGEAGFFPNGNFTFTDDLSATNLDYRWIGIRGPREAFISTSKKGLTINPFPTNIRATVPTSTLFIRQQHSTFDATVLLDYVPKTEKDLAGIVCYQKESFNYVFGVTKKGEEHYLLLARTDKNVTTVVASTKVELSKPVYLQVSADGDAYRFNYSNDGKAFQNLGGTVSGDILSTNVAGGFTGQLIGLYATTGNDIQL